MMKKVASLRYGVVFKKAFCDPQVFTAFAQDFLGIKLEISHVETEKAFDPAVGYVKPRFDLFAEDTKNRVIVDIQHERSGDRYDRFFYCHCEALLEQIAHSANYRPRFKVFTIVVLNSGGRHGKDILVTDFDPKDEAGKGIGEIPHKIIYLCPKYANGTLKDARYEWLKAIQDTLDEEVDESLYQRPEILRMFGRIMKCNISPEERAKMIDEYNQEELRQQAYSDGVKAGFEQVMNKFEMKAALEIAKALVDQGMPLEEIAKVIGLSVNAMTANEGSAP